MQTTTVDDDRTASGAVPLFVSVVVPAANEAESITQLLVELREVLEAECDQHEVIVVVPTPEDAGAAVAEGGGARVFVQKRPGYGGALKEGLLAARGDYIITMDADLSHPPSYVSDLLAHRDDAEVILCSRYVAGGRADMMSRWRHFLSRVLNLVYSRALAVPVSDMSSGYRLYQSKVFRELEIVGEKYDVLEEILVKIYSLGWTVSEIPFSYAERVGGASHASVVGFAPDFLRTLRRLFGVRNSFESGDYDSRAYDSIVIPQRYWQRKRYEIVTGMAGDRSPRLDIGCGSSRIIQSSPSAVGLDITLSKLRYLRKTNNKLIRGSTFCLPFKDASFDAVIHSQVIEHVRYDRSLFTELNRVLRPGGTLVIGTPDYDRVQWRVIEWFYKRLMPMGYGDDHITHYTRYSLTEELATAGFGIQEYKYILGGELIMKCVKREELSIDGVKSSDGPVDSRHEAAGPGA
jgi:dolichol-phosphate mannosyltransferase